jgi:hypothetical protein
MGIALFHLLPQGDGGLGLRLPDATPHPQARLRFNRGTAPVFPGFIIV